MSRRPCCIDANILFDFIAGGIIDFLFRMPYDFHIIDIVTDEISKTYSVSDLQRFGLVILELDEETVLEIDSLREGHPGLSLQDKSVFTVSRNLGMMILSNDGPLRELAGGSEIEYHGTIWLLEELVGSGNLSPRDAAAALRAMLRENRWLPLPECERLIKKWEFEK